MKSLGTLLEANGWTSAIVKAGVTSSGTTESFLAATSVTRTRLVHQITECTLYKLIKEAYQDYCTDECERLTLTFDEWRDQRLAESPQFQF